MYCKLRAVMHRLFQRNRAPRATQKDMPMANPPANADARHDPGWESARRTPRWVKIAGLLALIALALIVVMLVAGGGQHGPGRHTPGGGQQQQQQGGQMPDGLEGSQMPPGGGAGNHTPPPGH